jgi:hypothetical protein
MDYCAGYAPIERLHPDGQIADQDIVPRIIEQIAAHRFRRSSVLHRRRSPGRLSMSACRGERHDGNEHTGGRSHY